MTKLAQRVATLEANCATHKEDIVWMKRAVNSLSQEMIRVKTALWSAFVVGQIAAAGFAAWLSR